MTDTLRFLKNKYSLDFNQRSPICIPNTGRRQLPEIFKELGFKKGVEVGVAAGWFSSKLMQGIPDVELYGIDPYEKQPGYIDYSLNSTFNRLEAEAHERLDKYPKYHFVRKTSQQALNDFADGSLDFVYIDGDHSFESVTFDIAKWSKKLRKGGIISGHDFAKHKKQGVKIHVVQAVRGYTDAYHIHPWFILGNEANNEGLIRDKIRSWLWVVE